MSERQLQLVNWFINLSQPMQEHLFEHYKMMRDVAGEALATQQVFIEPIEAKPAKSHNITNKDIQQLRAYLQGLSNGIEE